MSFWLLIKRSLRFHARAHFGVVLGAGIGSAALIGALLVGDSVRGSLRDRALTRLGSISYALNTGDRFFRQELASGLEVISFERNDQSIHEFVTFAGQQPTTTMLEVPATATRQDSAARANQVNVYGVNMSVLRLLGSWSSSNPAEASEGGIDALLDDNATDQQKIRNQWNLGELVLFNQTLAGQLRVSAGDQVILRIHKPSLLAQDAAISPREDTSLALRLTVGPILPPTLLGDFSLQANQTPPANAFLPLAVLSQKLDLVGRANILVTGPTLSAPVETKAAMMQWRVKEWLSAKLPFLNRVEFISKWLQHLAEADLPTKEALQVLTTNLENDWSLEDAQLTVQATDPQSTAADSKPIPSAIELHSSRVFLEPPIVAAALKPRTRLLTDRAGITNDSEAELGVSQFVTNGVGILTYLANLVRAGDRATPYSMITAAPAPYTPPDLRDDEILINEWLADDLQAKPGDKIDVSYYAVDSASRLIERTNSFRVRTIVPLKGIYADRTLMPEFPGVAKAESTQDWDTGFPLTYKIRPKDEAYWKQYRGTPKAFITLAAGQAMWSTRFGNLTAIRYAIPPNSSPQACRDLVYRNLLANLDPAELGFHFEPVREQALHAADQSQDFGQLFIGFSLFLVVAALLLMALLFQFSLEQRRAEVGTLLALGLRPKQVRRLLLGEGSALALLGGIFGALAGLGYAKAMLWALTTVWRDAIGMSVLHFHASAGSLLTGLFAGVIVAILTIWLTLRKQARQPARELLSDEPVDQKSSTGRLARWVAGGAAVAGFALIVSAIARRQTADAEAFFEGGSLLLIAGLAVASAWLAALAKRARPETLNFTSLGVRGCARRRKRSLATVALLASGCFVIVSIGVFRLDANQDADKHSSGTAGFALIGQAALPIVQDLNTQSGRDFFGLNPQDLAGLSGVPFRVHEGDEASCLNLNRAQKPRLLGVKPELLAGRFTFTEVAKGLDIHQGWNLLKNSNDNAASSHPDEIAAIGDANSIQWALDKSVGDALDYTDENGRTFKLRLVGAVANSILQGSLIIDEAQFVKRFPTESGYRFFLLDAPTAGVAAISATLSRALQDRGLELTPAVQRLNAFNAVQNTYLGTFQILGGLGLLLGSAGLGVVVLRNVLERRGELGLLLAVGFRKRALRWLVLAEHGALLALGLALGVVAAAVAVLPAVLSPARQLPYGSLAVTLGAVLLNGFAWTWLATGVALRGNLLAALRNE